MSFYAVKVTVPCLTSKLEGHSVSVCTSFKICPSRASVIISKAKTRRGEIGVTHSMHDIHEKCKHKFFVRNKHKREDNFKMNLTGWYLNTRELLHLLHFMHNVSHFPSLQDCMAMAMNTANRFSLCDICGAQSSEYEECHLLRLHTSTLPI